MKLLIFDIDGTLTDTQKVDEYCFSKAYTMIFNKPLPNADWANYKNVTDTAILNQLYTSQFKSPLNKKSETLFQHCFFNNLENELQRNKDLFREIRGARTFINFCLDQENLRVAFATGGWGYSARLKLKAANIPCSNIPLVSSDDHFRRTRIVLLSIRRSSEVYNHYKYPSSVYFGDGVWDFDTAKSLNMRFVGVDFYHNQILSDLGAEFVINHYEHIPRIMNYLNY